MRGNGIKDLTWLRADGTEMSDQDWAADFAKVIGLMLSGDALDESTDRGDPITDDTFLLFCNAHHEDVEIVVPGGAKAHWRLILDTAEDGGFLEHGVRRVGGMKHKLRARSLVLFRLEEGTHGETRNAARHRGEQVI